MISRSVRFQVAAVGAALAAAGCNALLDIDDIGFGDKLPDAGSGGSSVGGSAGGMAGTGGTAGAGGTAGTGGTAGSGGEGGSVLGPWGSLQPVSVLNQQNAADDDPTFTADLTELYFNSDRSPSAPIWRSVRSSPTANWGSPTAVTEINSDYPDANNPVISPDGLTLWFANDPGTGDYDIYVTTRPNRSSSWPAASLVSQLNTNTSDLPCAVTDNGLIMVVTAQPNGDWDLFLSSRSSTAQAWGTPAAMTEFNTAADDLEVWLSPDGLHAYLRSEISGNSDLYRSSRPNTASPFDAPIAVDELNSSADESDPWLSPDRRYIMFVVGGLHRNIWEAHR